MYFALVAIILGAFSLVAWRDLKLALTLTIALAPAYLLRFSFPLPWTVLEGFVLLTFIVWLFKNKRVFNQDSLTRCPPLSLRHIETALAMGLIVATAAVIWAPNTLAALGIWKAYFLEPFLVYIMLRTTFTHNADWTRALTGLAMTTLGLSIFAVFQKLTGNGIPAPWDLERRVTSVFTYPNALGLFIAPIISALLVYGFIIIIRRQTKTNWSTKLYASAIAAGLVAIVLAQTEAALVAIPVAVIVTMAMWLSQYSPAQSTGVVSKKVWWLGLAGICVCGMVFATAIPGVRQKLLLQDYSGQVRRSQWSETLVMLKDRPLQGAGLAGYPTVFAPYHDPRLYEIFQYPHNLILNVWVELGVFGVLAWLWIATLACYHTWQQRDNPLVLAAFAALLTMTIHGLVDVPFLKNDLAVLTMFFLGMLTHNFEKPLARLAN